MFTKMYFTQNKVISIKIKAISFRIQENITEPEVLKERMLLSLLVDFVIGNFFCVFDDFVNDRF